MITTVTTTSVTTVTVMAIAATLGVVITLILVSLLLLREIAGASEDDRMIRWGRTLMIGIAPLLAAFAVIVAVKISQVM